MLKKFKLIIVISLLTTLDLSANPINEDDTSSSTSTTEFTTSVTDNPKDVIGICAKKYEQKRFRRVTFVRTFQRTYLAECCGGIKNCTHTKKLYRFGENYENLKPLVRYHPVCCKGYERDYETPYLPAGSIKCEAACDPPCFGGTCVSPQNCSCDRGFKNNPQRRYECISACSSNCDNATCVGHNLCECDLGFEHVDGEYCKPICSKGCTNGECVLPAQCKCLPGYDKDLVDPFKCNPVCSNGCGNGTCIAAETCKCPIGEEHSTEFKTCVYVPCNRDCGKGKCRHPPIMCDCPDGYVYAKRNDTCIPVCHKPKYAAKCVAPDKWECYKTYVEHNDTHCKEECDTRCGFGICARWNNEKKANECYPPNIEFEKFHLFYRFYKNHRGYHPRADNCEETGGRILAPWICKCPEGQHYIRPTAEHMKLRKHRRKKVEEKYCLDGPVQHKQFQKCLEKYHDTPLNPY